MPNGALFRAVVSPPLEEGVGDVPLFPLPLREGAGGGVNLCCNFVVVTLTPRSLRSR